MTNAATKVTKDPIEGELALVAAGQHRNPHSVLGAHRVRPGVIAVRVHRPDATAVQVIVGGDEIVAKQVHAAGIWAAELEGNDPLAYRLRVSYGTSVFEI